MSKKLTLYQILLTVVLLFLSFGTAIVLINVANMEIGDAIAILVAATAFFYLLVSAIRDQLQSDYNERKRRNYLIVDLEKLNEEQLAAGDHDGTMYYFGELSKEEFIEFKRLEGDIDKLTFLISYKVNHLKKPNLAKTHIVNEQKAIIEYVD